MQAWQDILYRQCEHLRLKEPSIINQNINTRVAVIIEPRKHLLLEPVIRNVMHYLGPNWNLEVITCDQHIPWVKEQFPHSNFRITGIPFDNINQTIYNIFLMHSWFWHRLSEEHVLIFQTDCIMFRPGVDAYLEYDYVGANYYNQLHVSPNGRGIQGGFSLRKRSAMLDCITRVSWNDIQQYRSRNACVPLETLHEDIFFTHACEMLKKKTLSQVDAPRFSIEADFYTTPIAHHGTTKQYFTQKQIHDIIFQCEDRVMWS